MMWILLIYHIMQINTFAKVTAAAVECPEKK